MAIFPILDLKIDQQTFSLLQTKSKNGQKPNAAKTNDPYQKLSIPRL
jgi:hypothetical protein